MNLMRTLSLAAALSAAVVSAPPHSEGQRPQTAPTRDINIRSRGLVSRQSLNDGDGWLANTCGGSTDQISPRPSLIKAGGNSRSLMRQIIRISRCRGQLPSGCPREQGRL
jgi:hypothetical protein